MSGGTKNDTNKPMMHLIPPEAEEEEAWVWTFGAKKYDDYNWHKGFPISRLISATQRHLTAIKKGELIDMDSGRFHAAHIRCNMAMMIYFQKNLDKYPNYLDMPNMSLTPNIK